MTRIRAIRVFVALCAVWAVDCRGANDREATVGYAVAGNYLVVGLKGEPLTWNLLLASETGSKTIASRLHACLVRVNPESQEVEAELAESWSFSEDGKVLTFQLRSGVHFSDGVPFTAEDVAFTFRALHDPQLGSPLAETATVQGRPLVAEVVNERTVRFRLPCRTAVVERLFDGIGILPRHRLEASLAEGGFASRYGVGAPEDAIVGLGPFVLARYLPGQRVVLRRNPHYWKKGPKGEKLPYLDGIVFEILPDSNARLLKFAAGELDIQGQLLPEDFKNLQEKKPPGLRLLDLGPGLDTERLWFNVNPRSPTVSEEKRSWFGDEKFRRAISFAVDRTAIVEAVYHGLASPASGPVSPANAEWRNQAIAPPTLNRNRSRRLLKQAGFRWSSEGVLLSGSDEPVRFNLITNGDNRHRSRMALLIQEDLARLGIEVAFVPLDFADVVGRVTRSFDYEACLLGITQNDPDPSAEAPLWHSRAPLHFWNPSQVHPATDWEARIDDLMERQMVTLNRSDRKKLYDEVQRILGDEMPLIDLVVPHSLLGVNRRVKNLKPTPYLSPPLWNCEELYLSGSVLPGEPTDSVARSSADPNP